MDIRHLRYFVAVVDGGSFTAAAARLGVAQPTVSWSVRRLEAELGAVLFDRSGPVVALTPAGNALLPEARRALAALDAGREAVQRAHDGEVGHVAFGIPAPLWKLGVPEAIRIFRNENPDVRLHVHQSDSVWALYDGVRQERYDLAIAYSHLVPLDEFTVDTLLSERLMVTVRRDHPLADRARVTIRELTEHPVVAYAPHVPDRDTRRAAVPGLRIEATLTVDGISGAMLQARGGEFCCFLLPSVLAPDDPVLVQVEIEGDLPSLSTLVVSAAGRPLSKAAQRLRELLIDAQPAKADVR